MLAMKDPSGAAFAIGRLGGWEPLGFEAGDNNWYRFVANGPTGKTDPSGLITRTLLKKEGKPLAQFSVEWSDIILDNDPPCDVVIIEDLIWSSTDVGAGSGSLTTTYYVYLGTIPGKGENRTLAMKDEWSYIRQPESPQPPANALITVYGRISAYSDPDGSLQAEVSKWKSSTTAPRRYLLNDYPIEPKHPSSKDFETNHHVFETEEAGVNVNAVWRVGAERSRVEITGGKIRAK